VKRKALQSFADRNSAAKSLGPVPSAGPGARIRTALFVTTPVLQKSGGETCPLGVWGWRSCLGLRRVKKAVACSSLRPYRF
jgi:hypothetical protein